MRALFISLLLLMSANAQSSTWWHAVATEIHFKIVNAGISVDGTFNSIHANVHWNPDDLVHSSLQGTALVKSIQTGNTLRDRHLNEKVDFFDATQFPELHLSSTHIVAAKKVGIYHVDWILELKGQQGTLQSELFLYRVGLFEVAYTTFKLQRQAWQLGSQSTSMSNDVEVTIVALLHPSI